ncbi:MAG: flagellar biosynthesis anti-sigma factor FlgM [Bdellovibrionales bacterium RIFOXYD1_FULL_44_7]|nr:MAG: flagellar biosynthesis anti-sigma factor FlgM [Bdellovibrionales bacterium RIFOXYD1_FULL_44_7]
MRVNQTGTNPATSSEVSGTQQAQKAAEARKTKKTDKTGNTSASGSTSADISAKGKEMARAKAAANNAPDVREQKIAELKRRIAEGKYKVDDKAVADRLVDNHLETNGIG